MRAVYIGWIVFVWVLLAPVINYMIPGISPPLVYFVLFGLPFIIRGLGLEILRPGVDIEREFRTNFSAYLFQCFFGLLICAGVYFILHYPESYLAIGMTCIGLVIAPVSLLFIPTPGWEFDKKDFEGSGWSDAFVIRVRIVGEVRKFREYKLWMKSQRKEYLTENFHWVEWFEPATSVFQPVASGFLISLSFAVCAACVAFYGVGNLGTINPKMDLDSFRGRLLSLPIIMSLSCLTMWRVFYLFARKSKWVPDRLFRLTASLFPIDRDIFYVTWYQYDEFMPSLTSDEIFAFRVILQQSEQGRRSLTELDQQSEQGRRSLTELDRKRHDDWTKNFSPSNEIFLQLLTYEPIALKAARGFGTKRMLLYRQLKGSKKRLSLFPRVQPLFQPGEVFSILEEGICQLTSVQCYSDKLKVICLKVYESLLNVENAVTQFTNTDITQNTTVWSTQALDCLSEISDHMLDVEEQLNVLYTLARRSLENNKAILEYVVSHWGRCDYFQPKISGGLNPNSERWWSEESSLELLKLFSERQRTAKHYASRLTAGLVASGSHCPSSQTLNAMVNPRVLQVLSVVALWLLGPRSKRVQFHFAHFESMQIR